MATSTKAKKKTVRLASGRKRARQDVKLNAANTALRSRFRSAIKNVQKAVLSGDKAKATDLFKSAQSVIDSIADKGIFHKNKAARHKSRLSAKLKAEEIIVIDDLVAKEAKTKALAGVFASLGLTNALIIGGAEIENNFKLAAQNIPNVDVLPVQGINVYDILRRGKLVLSKAAVEALEERFK